MERFGIIGLSSRRGGAAALPELTITREDLALRLPALARQLGVDELVYLATCNRVEVVFSKHDDRPLAELRPSLFRLLAQREPEPGEAERLLRMWGGEGAVEHVFLVASGLDSSQIGEREIRAQMRDAVKIAREVGTCGTRLGHLFDSALRLAARIHERTSSPRRTSLADIAADHLIERLRETGGAAALVGVSPMTRRAARRLAAEEFPFVVVNRTLSRGVELAEEFGQTAVSLDRFRQRPQPIEALLLAVSSPTPILDRAALERIAARVPSGHPPFLVDLGVPPNTDPEDARAASVTRIDMQEISREAEASRQLGLRELAPVRELIDRGLEQYRRMHAERVMAPVVAELNRRYRRTAEAGVERLLGKELGALRDPNQDAVRRWAEVLARRLAHIPTKGLKRLAAEYGDDAVRVFLEGADAADLLPAEDSHRRVSEPPS